MKFYSFLIEILDYKVAIYCLRLYPGLLFSMQDPDLARRKYPDPRCLAIDLDVSVTLMVMSALPAATWLPDSTVSRQFTSAVNLRKH